MPNTLDVLPASSVGKESACNAEDPSSIPGLGRSAGEEIGYPLQCSWASLVAHLVKNLPAMWKTWVQSLGWEDPLKKGKATHPSILVWRIPWTLQSMGSQRVRHNWATFTFQPCSTGGPSPPAWSSSSFPWMWTCTALPEDISVIPPQEGHGIKVGVHGRGQTLLHTHPRLFPGMKSEGKFVGWSQSHRMSFHVG